MKKTNKTIRKKKAVEAQGQIRYSFFVRHGERSDALLHMDNKVDLSVDDPVLTPNGIKQAKESGHFLRRLLKEIE